MSGEDVPDTAALHGRLEVAADLRTFARYCTPSLRDTYLALAPLIESGALHSLATGLAGGRVSPPGPASRPVDRSAWGDPT